VAALLAGEIDTAIIGPGHLLNAGLSGADLIGMASIAVTAANGWRAPARTISGT